MPIDNYQAQVTLPFVAAVVIASILVFGVAFVAAQRSDDVAMARQVRVIGHALAMHVAEVAHDQESVTIWDEAVLNISTSFDEKWADVNIGTWMHDFFAHDEAVVLNADDRIIYSMADGTRHGAETELGPGIQAMVGKIRGIVAAGGIAAYREGRTQIPESSIWRSCGIGRPSSASCRSFRSRTARPT